MAAQLKISSIGLLAAVKFPVQEHTDHAVYSYLQNLRIDGIGLLSAVKLPAQDHTDHAIYSYLQNLRIDGVGNFAESAENQRVRKVSIVRSNRLAVPEVET